jgi:hypothetical protein
VPVVARGAGTGLSGGAMPHAQGVTLSLAKFNKILKMDVHSRTAVVQCGVRNLAISEAAAPLGLYYAPDPSSQIACTIGGNVAENSGGVHCLKYGLTLHNVLKVKGFTMDGEPIEFGGDALDAPGLDLLPLVVGSEGMLAVTTEVTVKLTPKPQIPQHWRLMLCRTLQKRFKLKTFPYFLFYSYCPLLKIYRQQNPHLRQVRFYKPLRKICLLKTLRRKHPHIYKTLRKTY